MSTFQSTLNSVIVSYRIVIILNANKKSIANAKVSARQQCAYEGS